MAAIEPAATLEPTTAAEEDGLNEFDDPEHPSFWEEKLKPNPAYQGPADVAFNKNSQVKSIGQSLCIVDSEQIGCCKIEQV